MSCQGTPILAHMRGNFDARAEYIKRLPADKFNEVLETIVKGIQLHVGLIFNDFYH